MARVRKKKEWPSHSPRSSSSALSSQPKIQEIPKDKKIQHLLKDLQTVESKIEQTIFQMKEKVRQLECLTQFSSSLNASLNLQEVGVNAVQAIQQLLNCKNASILSFHSQKKEWVDLVSEKAFPMTINKAWKRAYEQKASVLQNENKPTQSNYIVVPLLRKNEFMGLLEAKNKKETFTEEDLLLLQTLGHQVVIALENALLYHRLKKSFFDTVQALAEAIDKKDHYTGGHIKRVVHFSVCIAKHIPLDEEEIDRVRLAAILHDVGKIGIEDHILKKPAPLDLYEWPLMKKHPELGYQIMKQVEGLEDVIEGMRFHHERWDGKGYPMGLKGEEIPLIARIISVGDTYDAMVSKRPYKNGMHPEKAYDEIVRHAGTQFCPKVVEAFKKAYRLEKMGQTLRKKESDSPLD